MGNQPVDVTKVSPLNTVRESLDLLETDLAQLITKVGDAARHVHSGIGQSGNFLRAIRELTDELSKLIARANEDARQLAAATHEFVASSNEIGRQVETAASMAIKATRVATDADSSISDLDASSSEIGNITGLIARIAKQTQLLALNATIEAARAGSAGRGFAVVASEVKALSVETQRSAEEISKRVNQLQKTAKSSSHALKEIASVIADAQPMYAAISAAVAEQTITAESISANAATTSRFVNQVSNSIEHIRHSTESADRGNKEVYESGQEATNLAAKLRRNLSIFIRQTEIGDRREFDRLPSELSVNWTVSRPTKTIDIGLGGALVHLEGEAAPAAVGENISLRIEEIGDLSAKIVNRSTLGAHLKFIGLSSETQTRLEQKVLAIQNDNAEFIERASKAGSEVSACLEQLVVLNRLTPEALFDNEYVLIPGTDPQQYRTKYLDAFEHVLSPIQERLLDSDARMVFALAIDRNGYIPVHNRKYSQPQRPNDPGWNIANSRNRRIFDDRAGLCAARSVRPYLLQNYPRDMGSGVVVMMKEIDVPLRVLGKHWGGFRMAYQL
jgi:methyl-accepting chemotaxis protein